MKHEIAMDLLSAATYGTLTTTELIDATHRSPTTVVRYLGQLERCGWVKRIPAERLGVGRPPVLRVPTDAGLAYLRQSELAWFRSLAGNGVRILWGPVRSLAFWGIPFVGRPDVFTNAAIDARPFPLVLERHALFYEDARETDEGRFPSLESLVAWAAQSGDPRFAAAAVVLLRDRSVDRERLAGRAAGMGARNRVGFLASLAGRSLGLAGGRPRERMLPAGVSVEPETEALARRWRVENPISAALVEDMERLYGDAR